MNNPIDIANQIAAASAPLVVAPAVAVPAVAVAAPAPLVVAAPVAAVVVPPINPEALVAEAAADGIVVAGAAPVTAVVTPGAATTATTEPAPVLTKAETLAKAIAGEQAKIDAATKRRDLLTSQLASIDKISSIVAGSIIIAALGRAETARQVRAVVTGVKAEGTTTKFKILVGEGFDATTEVINEGQVVSVE